MTLFLMILHLAAALAILAGWSAGKLHTPPALLPAVVLLPLWGPACAVAVECHVRGGEKSDEEPETGRFGITDEVYRSIRMEEGGVANVLPMEDVLTDGAPAQRRNLLLSVLHAGPAPFVRPLRIAGVNDDTEVVHYAVTALVELRSGYAQRIADMEERLRAHPGDGAVLLAAADLDEEYIRSGIPEKNERADRIAHCRSMLEKLLQYYAWQEAGGTAGKAAGAAPGSPADESAFLRAGAPKGQGLSPLRLKRLCAVRRLGEMCILQDDSAGAREAAEALLKEAPDCEAGILLLVQALAAARDGAGIREVLEAVRRRGTYLSPAAREQLAFWSEP